MIQRQEGTLRRQRLLPVHVEGRPGDTMVLQVLNDVRLVSLSLTRGPGTAGLPPFPIMVSRWPPPIGNGPIKAVRAVQLPSLPVQKGHAVPLACNGNGGGASGPRRHCLLPLHALFGLSRLTWHRDFAPEVYERIDCVLML